MTEFVARFGEISRFGATVTALIESVLEGQQADATTSFLRRNIELRCLSRPIPLISHAPFRQ
jgi:hypothetical protein